MPALACFARISWFERRGSGGGGGGGVGGGDGEGGRWFLLLVQEV